LSFLAVRVSTTARQKKQKSIINVVCVCVRVCSVRFFVDLLNSCTLTFKLKFIFYKIYIAHSLPKYQPPQQIYSHSQTIMTQFHSFIKEIKEKKTHTKNVSAAWRGICKHGPSVAHGCRESRKLQTQTRVLDLCIFVRRANSTLAFTLVMTEA